jgi:hypothetical protein
MVNLSTCPYMALLWELGANGSGSIFEGRIGSVRMGCDIEGA